MKIFFYFLILISTNCFSSLEQCGIKQNQQQVQKLDDCKNQASSKTSIKDQYECYLSVYESTIEEMKKSTIQQQSPTLRNLLSEVRKSFQTSNEPNKLLNYYESMELYRAAKECKEGIVKLYSFNEEIKVHELLDRECRFSDEQNNKALSVAIDNLNNHYALFEAGKKLNQLSPLLEKQDGRKFRSEPEPLAFRDCLAGMPPGAYPPENFIKKEKVDDNIICPEWMDDSSFCSKKENSNLNAGLLAHQFFIFGIKLQLEAFSEHLLSTNPKNLNNNQRVKINEKVEEALSVCIENKNIDKDNILNDFSKNLLNDSYFSPDSYDKYEKMEASEVAASIKKLKITENYFNKISKKFSKLSNYYQMKCGLSYWFPQWGYKSTDECEFIKEKLDDFNLAIINPTKQIIDAERNRFPFLSIPLSGGEFGSSKCFTGVLDDMANNPLSYMIYGKYSITLKNAEFNNKSKSVHYDLSCGKPLWKGAGDSKKYKTIQTKSSLAFNNQDKYSELKKTTKGKGIYDRAEYPSGDKFIELINLELDQNNPNSEINQLQTFFNDLNSQTEPTENEIRLTAKLKQEANKGIEDALLKTLKNACDDPIDYGNELMLNDNLAKTFFSKNDLNINDKKLFCKTRQNYAEKSSTDERNLSDATIGIGMIGFIHPVAALTVLPIEFGLEYIQFKEAQTDRQRNLSLSLLGLEDYSKADKELETLKSEELMFYGIIGAMALGGAGDIADFVGDISKFNRFKKTASSITDGISKSGLEEFNDFQRKILAIEKSNLSEIEKRLEILDQWKLLENSLPPDDFLKIKNSLSNKIDTIKRLLSRDIKFEFARDFAKNDFAYFIDDLQSINNMEEIEILITAYKKAKQTPENYEAFVEILKRRGASCGV